MFLFIFITGNHFSKGNVPGINLNFSSGDIVSKYSSRKISPEGAPVDGSRLFVMFEQDGLWGKCTVHGYESDENYNDEWAMKVYFDNHAYQSLRWKTVQYLHLIAHLETNDDGRKLYTRIVNMKNCTELAGNSDGGMFLS